MVMQMKPKDYTVLASDDIGVAVSALVRINWSDDREAVTSLIGAAEHLVNAATSLNAAVRIMKDAYRT